MMKKLIFVAVLVLCAFVGAANTTPILAPADTLHKILYNWDSPAISPTKPESIIVVVTGPNGDSVFSDKMDTTSSKVIKRYFDAGDARQLRVVSYAQPVSAIINNKGEGLYEIHWFVTGLGDTAFAYSELFQVVDTTLNNTLNQAATDKVTLTDSSAAAIDLLSLMFGVGNDATNPLRQVIFPIGSYNKDSIWMLQSPYTSADTVFKLFYYRSAGAVDSIRGRRTTP